MRNQVPINEPVKSEDYVYIRPDSFSVTRVLDETGNGKLILSLIESKFSPVVRAGQHGVEVSPTIRCTLDLPVGFLEEVLRMVAALNVPQVAEGEGEGGGG